MSNSKDATGSSNEIFSFHLVKVGLREVPRFFLSPLHERNVPGLLHSESFFSMKLGEPISSAHRYDLTTVSLFARWKAEEALDEFLSKAAQRSLASGWHVRMKLYRRWGHISELADAVVTPEFAERGKPVVAVTLARLNLRETLRFIQWGKPVERQVRDHAGQVLALAAIRPPNTFSTFSIWKDEPSMIDMVTGRDKARDGEEHLLAMQERTRRDFHKEFSTMRFAPFKEVGSWDGLSGYTNENGPAAIG